MSPKGKPLEVKVRVIQNGPLCGFCCCYSMPVVKTVAEHRRQTMQHAHADNTANHPNSCSTNPGDKGLAGYHGIAVRSLFGTLLRCIGWVWTVQGNPSPVQQNQLQDLFWECPNLLAFKMAPGHLPSRTFTPRRRLSSQNGFWGGMSICQRVKRMIFTQSMLGSTTLCVCFSVGLKRSRFVSKRGNTTKRLACFSFPSQTISKPSKDTPEKHFHDPNLQEASQGFLDVHGAPVEGARLGRGKTRVLFQEGRGCVF